MTVTLPATVQIGWKTFTVVAWDHQVALAKQRYGECDHLESTIRVDTSFGDMQIIETFLHELFHAAFDVGQANQDRTNTAETFTEEFAIGFLASWLTTILKQNPELIGLLAQGIAAK